MPGRTASTLYHFYFAAGYPDPVDAICGAICDVSIAASILNKSIVRLITKLYDIKRRGFTVFQEI